MLHIQNLYVSINEKQIIKGLDLEIKPGEIHVVLGPNGSGKSTLAYTLAGHPSYKIQNPKSKIKIGNSDVLEMTPDERAKAGLFLAFQNPQRLDGVSVMSFLRTAHKNLCPSQDLALFEFKNLVEKEAQDIGLKPELLQRSVNDGFSGGERKRFEMLQLRLFKPKFAVIDEIDSGLDVDALKSVALAIQKSVDEFGMGALIITHYQRLLKYLSYNSIHVMIDGRIVATGKEELLEQVEKEGYKKYTLSS